MQDTRLAGEALVDSLLRSVHGEPAESKILPTRLWFAAPAVVEYVCNPSFTDPRGR
jgi:hypothetical protein